MKNFFIPAAIMLALFEIAHVYFIMPFPYSQQLDSINIAYFLHKWRWLFRITLTFFILINAFSSFKNHTKLSSFFSILLFIVIYFFNFKMTAERMFLQPSNFIMTDKESNKINLRKLIMGVNIDGIARAYPIQLIAYHHQVIDQFNDVTLMISYCSVCRTGRVFKPFVDNIKAKFRLVGMNHFNAMFEDEKTKSWWQQENGEAVAGNLKGRKLEEISYKQLTLGNWLKLYPNSLILQEDTTFKKQYAALENYESGSNKSFLTGTDTNSWHNKSWIIGIEVNGIAKAYDWNKLKEQRVINDSIGNTQLAVILASDDKSFVCFERYSATGLLKIKNDTIYLGNARYTFDGNPDNDLLLSLKTIQSYQEFWHSWKTFHPSTLTYK